MIQSTYQIRKATTADAAALARCRRELFKELGSSPDDANTAFETLCQDTLARFLADGTCVGWLAERPGVEAPVGAIVILTYPRLPSPRNRRTTEAYLLNVYVVPAERHKGVALALTQVAVDHARSAGFARLRLHASAYGRRVYERAGFRGRDDEMEMDLLATAL